MSFGFFASSTARFLFAMLAGSASMVQGQETNRNQVAVPAIPDGPFAVVLGIAQDGGYPQSGCNRACCQPAWENPSARRHVSCIAIVDPETSSRWMLDCTPDFRDQLRMLDSIHAGKNGDVLSGIFLTHAHIGHYTGLMHLGREAIGTTSISVHAMPRMQKFLETNGPWSQLVLLKNIELRPLEADKPVQLTESISVTPIIVPHRDEFSETVAFRISGPNQTVLYLPDIDKWSRWDRSIEQIVQEVDVALLDGTFFDAGELPGRDMSQIPHPLVTESLQQFSTLDSNIRSRVTFIHLNHTNPLLQSESPARRTINQSGMHVANELQIIKL